MNQHTPGPWASKYATAENGIARFIWTATDKVTGHRELVAMIPESTGNHWNADAHLIASAPDMLAMLREVVALLEDPEADHFDANRVQREVEAVIAKAMGGAP